MTLYDRIKEALRRGAPPAQVAAMFGVSENLVLKTAELIRRVEPREEPKVSV